MRFTTNAGRDKIAHFSLYTKCSSVPIIAFAKKRFAVSEKGKFTIDGTFVDALERKVRFEVHGQFQNKGKVATSTHDVDGAGDYDCDDRERDVAAKYQGDA